MGRGHWRNKVTARYPGAITVKCVHAGYRLGQTNRKTLSDIRGNAQSRYRIHPVCAQLALTVALMV